MALTKTDIQDIATLARLQFDESELERFAGQMSSILEYIEKLGELNTDAVEPTAHTQGEGTPLREDVLVENKAHESVLEHAPDHEDSLFKVPKVIT
jgi:aspartyl-tRNA(Asn)/glutamyl-tRNA(Gln) amidotransferase subunit C